MKKIGLDTFMDFQMLSSLTFSPDGGKLAYVLHMQLPTLNAI